MYTVFRWETINGNGPASREDSEYKYVFTTLKSAMMWCQSLAWGYDNPEHNDLVLCMYESDECYPVLTDLGTKENPEGPSMCNMISDYCSEYRARVYDRTVISYMSYEQLKTFGKLLSKCKSKKTLKEFLDVKELDSDFAWMETYPRWIRYSNNEHVLEVKSCH